MKRSILFTNQEWTDKNKDRYQNEYLKLKKSCKKFYASTKDSKEVKLWSYGKCNLFEELWADIIDEQLYKPKLSTRLSRRIW